MLLIIPFVFCLFDKIIIFCFTKCMTEPPTKLMNRHEEVDQMYSSVYAMINDCNSVTLGMKRCNESEYFPGS